MPHLPNLSGERRDRILFLIYLIVVPVMVVTVLAIVLVQTRQARDDTRRLAQQTCTHVNRRDLILRGIVGLAVSVTKSLNPDLTADQQESLSRIERRARLLIPQDCSP